MERSQSQLFTKQKRIYFYKEESILNKLAQVSSSTKSPISKGRIFEDEFAKLLSEMLPNIFTVHRRSKVIDQFGQISNEIDIAITDSRFPILAFNEDDTKLLCYESVLAVIELKCTYDKSAIVDIFQKGLAWANYKKANLKRNKKRYRLGIGATFWSLSLQSKVYLKTALHNIRKIAQADSLVIETQHYLLRLHPQEWSAAKNPIGTFIWWEGCKDLSWNKTVSPLSDFIMMLFEALYRSPTLHKQDFDSITMLMFEYFRWGSLPFEMQSLNLKSKKS